MFDLLVHPPQHNNLQRGYGRWVNVGSQWFWVPDSVNTNPIYSPALVAFVPAQSDMIGWVPLGPGDPYALRYYDAIGSRITCTTRR